MDSVFSSSEQGAAPAPSAADVLLAKIAKRRGSAGKNPRRREPRPDGVEPKRRDIPAWIRLNARRSGIPAETLYARMRAGLTIGQALGKAPIERIDRSEIVRAEVPT